MTLDVPHPRRTAARPDRPGQPGQPDQPCEPDQPHQPDPPAWVASPRARALAAVSFLAVLLTGVAVVVVDDATSPPGAAPDAALPWVAGGFGPSGVGGEPGRADGRIGDAAVDIDDRDLPAISGLEPGLAAAVADATEAAAQDGVVLRITSGWRSARYQRWLLDDAVARYGSRDEALRWVATPDTSRHVTGDAVDVGPTEASSWMSDHGSRFGLCQTMANEVWHYELATTPGGTCPAMRADNAS